MHVASVFESFAAQVDQVNKIVAVVSNPLQFKIPSWMLNRQRDNKDGKTSQKYANFLDQALREAWPLLMSLSCQDSCGFSDLHEYFKILALGLANRGSCSVRQPASFRILAVIFRTLSA